jgi:acetylornithine deacetylase
VDPTEQRVVEEIAGRRDELVALASELIAFDTTARHPEDPPRQEAELQGYLAERLARRGAAVDVWEPAPEDVAGTRQVVPGLGFEGRPQLAATFTGAGGGRSLLLNGHIDVVTPEPVDRWTSDPWRAEVRDGNLHGRGACDMKGGVACMTFAAEVLAQLGVRLAGDVVVCTVTDEESSGAGGIAAVRHGVRADAGIVTEPTGFDVWVACRGSLTPVIRVEGRPGHAEMRQPHWRAGGAVNAIEKMGVLLDAVRRLRDEWLTRPDKQHPYLAPGTIVPVVVRGGEWEITYPAACSLTCELMYLPANADADGWGTLVEAELREWIAAAAAADPWLREHPPTIDFGQDIPPSEVPPDHPLIAVMAGASADVGEPTRLGGLDSWYDAASFTRLGGTPCIGYGPRDIAWGHTIDEYVPVEDLVRCAQGLALAAMRWCGVADGGR